MTLRSEATAARGWLRRSPGDTCGGECAAQLVERPGPVEGDRPRRPPRPGRLTSDGLGAFAAADEPSDGSRDCKR